MSIGSVPPDVNVHCIRNVLFDNINMHKPYKGIYVKSNPGTVGSAIVENITYSNMLIDSPQWYGVWIGPQQQEQPGTAGTGCSFLYPTKIGGSCPTDPLVTMRDIKLYNISMPNGGLMPGVIHCDPTNPCTGIEFNNVATDGDFTVEKHYVCDNASGTYTDSNIPPDCLKNN